MKNHSRVGGIILVGGLGTRLRPLTLSQPKALLPVLNKPFLLYQFQLLHKIGIRDVVLAANPWFRRWQKDIKKIAPPKMRIHFAFEPKPYGTGGAIRFGYDELCKRAETNFKTVLVFNGDVLIDINLTDCLHFHEQRQSECTIALEQVLDPSRFGLVNLGKSGRITSFVEKPKRHRGQAWINAGVYVINSGYLKTIPRRQVSSIERDIFPKRLSENWPMFAFKRRGYWNDIGTPESYLQAHRDLMRHPEHWTETGLLCKARILSNGARLIKVAGSRISKNVKFEGVVCLGEKVHVSHDCYLKDVVIMRGTRIEEGSRIVGSILGRDCRVGEYSYLGRGTILGDQTKLPRHSRT